jgi:hypothetical protein
LIVISLCLDSGGKFVRGRGMGKEIEVNEYELQRAANIKENLKRMRSLNLHVPSTMVNEEANGSHRANKKYKVNVFPYLISPCFLHLI